MSSGLGELTAQANQLVAAGELAAAHELLDNTLSAADPSPARASAELADAAALQARVLISLGEPHTARGWAAFAYSAATRQYGTSDPRTVAAAATLAAILHRVGSHARAGRLYREVIIELTATDGPESLRVLAAHADLATVEYARGECQVARDRLQDAWELHREVYGDAHAGGIKMLARLGAMQRDCGLLSEGYENLALARELCRQHLPPDHPLAVQIGALAEAAPDPRHACGAAPETPGPGPDPADPSPGSEPDRPGQQTWWPAQPSLPPEVTGFVSPGGPPGPPPPPPVPVPEPRAPHEPAYQQDEPAYQQDEPADEDGGEWPDAPGRPTDGAGGYDDEERYSDEDWYGTANRSYADTPAYAAPQADGAPYDAVDRTYPPEEAPGVRPVAGLPARREPAKLPVPIPRPPRPPDRRLAPAVFAGLLAVLLGAIIVVAGFALVNEPGGESGNESGNEPGSGPGTGATAPPATGPAGSPTASPAPAQAAPGTPPTELRLRDGRDRVTLSWRYPAGAAGPVVISGGRAGQELRAFHELPAGTASYIVYSLSPETNYCFSVAVVYSVDTLGRAKPVCTDRPGAAPDR